METYTIQHPSLLPTQAPVPGVRMSAVADVPQLSRVHCVPAQAELILAAVDLEGNGTSVFRGKGIPAAVKPMTQQGARGVPPRGRPV